MSTFMNTDPKAFSGVWVFCEQRQGKMMPTTFELISEGRKLADELGVQLSGILLGDSVDGIAAELGGYGADKVYVYNSPLLKDYTTDAYTKIITDAVTAISAVTWRPAAPPVSTPACAPTAPIWTWISTAISTSSAPGPPWTWTP